MTNYSALVRTHDSSSILANDLSSEARYDLDSCELSAPDARELAKKRNPSNSAEMKEFEGVSRT